MIFLHLPAFPKDFPNGFPKSMPVLDGFSMGEEILGAAWDWTDLAKGGRVVLLWLF